MSVGSIINSATGRIYDDLIPQGGGIPLTKGQLITADATDAETALAVGADGAVLSADSTQPLGLRWIANPAGIPLDYQELISANPANATTIVPAPTANNYVLTSDNTLGAGSAGMAWKPIAGPSGTITSIAPLQDLEPVAGTNELSIAFTAVKGEIPAGTGVAKTGALVPAPTVNNYALISDSTTATGLAWKALAGGGVITANPPLVDTEPVAGTNEIAINFSASIGEIPYGTGVARQGALTNAPVAGQILGMAGAPLQPTWINAGGSGTITANLPLIESAGAGNESNISIGFTATKGEIPAGNGTANTGGLLSLGTAGQILAVNTTTTLGLEWIDAPVGTGYIPYFQELPSLAQNANITPSGSAPIVDITTGDFVDIPVSSISGNPSLNPLTFVDFYIQFEITNAGVLGGASKIYLNPVFQVATAVGQPYGPDLQFNIPVFTLIQLNPQGFLLPPATQIGTTFCRGEIEITALNPTDVIKFKVNAVCDTGSLDLNDATGMMNISCNVSKSA